MRQTKYMVGLLTLMLMALVLGGCGSDDDIQALETKIAEQEGTIASLQAKEQALEADIEALVIEIMSLEEQLNTLGTSNSVLATSLTVIELIGQQDMGGLASYVHPQKGLRFSPYAYLEESDLIFTATEVADLLSDTEIYLWGAFDGTGYPIEKSFNDYYARFVYDHDFANPHLIGNNFRVAGHGGVLNNIEDVYPDGHFIEFSFTGFDPQFVGMDWRSLRLVFEEVNGTWLLVAIVHDEWTT